MLLDGGGYLEGELLNGDAAVMTGKLQAARESLAAAGLPVPAVEAMARYDWVARTLDGIVRRPECPSRHVQRPDRRSAYPQVGRDAGLRRRDGADVLVDLRLGGAADVDGWMPRSEVLPTRSVRSLPEGALRSLVVDGVIGGVGAVLVFLPQILILFFFIALLEDCGYMARAAFLMDRLMAGVGLSGKSFIPLLSSFACAIPGIMATRVIENRRDRLATILIAPLMSCSARLPVYVILIGAFVPAQKYLGGLVGLQGLTLLAMYSVGVIVAVGVAWVLKRSILRGETPPFVLELPSYKIPSLRNVVYRMAERGWSFVARAGTVIFAVTIVVWALAYYPRSDERVAGEIAAQRAQLVASAATAAELAAFDDPAHLERLGASLHQRTAFSARPGSGSSRPCGRSAGTGGSAARRSPRSRRARS